MAFPVASGNALAVSKPPMLALFTNVGTGGAASWNLAKSGYGGNTKLIDVLSCTVVTTNSDGGLAAKTNNGLPQIYLPVSALSASNKICVQNLSAGNSTSGNSAAGTRIPSSVIAGFASLAYLFMGIGL